MLVACSLSGNRGRSSGEYRRNGKQRRDEGVQEEREFAGLSGAKWFRVEHGT